MQFQVPFRMVVAVNILVYITAEDNRETRGLSLTGEGLSLLHVPLILLTLDQVQCQLKLHKSNNVFNVLGQALASCGPWAKSSPPACFGLVQLDHSHTRASFLH